MLRPLLIVGVGGSGGKSVRRLRQSLQRQLRRVDGWHGGIPAAWQLTFVDWQDSQSADGDPSPLLPSDDYCGLWPSGVANWHGVHPRLEQKLNPTDYSRLLAGWFDPETPIGPAGGNQLRAAGRMLGAVTFDKAKAAIDRWHATMSSDVASAELAALEKCLGIPSDGARPPAMAIVISSLAGGTGAGLFMEITAALHAVDPTFASTQGMMSILYTADVFGNLPESLRVDVAANGLAAAMEVTSGVLNSERSPATRDLLSASGVLVPPGSFAGAYNFLIGRTNTNGVSFSGQDEVYQAVGECLTALLLDDGLLTDLANFTLLAAFKVTYGDSLRLLEASNPSQTYPFAGIGVAKVSLGTDRLGDYSAQILTTDVVEQLLWPDFRPDDGNKVPRQVLIEDAAANNFPRFLESSGLDEINPADQVITALAGNSPVITPNQPFALIYASQEAMEASTWATGVTSYAPAPSMDGAGWQSTFQTYWDTQRQAPVASAEANLWVQSHRWTVEIQDRVTELVARTCVQVGLDVTIELLTKLRDEVRTSSSQLDEESGQLRAWSTGCLHEAQRQLSVGKAKMTAADQAVQEAIGHLTNGVLWECAAKRHALAASLLRDLDTNLLACLQDTLENAGVRMRSAVNATLIHGRENPWKVMPRFGRPTPTQFLPGPVEKLLIDPAAFEQRVTDAVRAGLAGPEQGSWRTLARERAGLALHLGTGEGKQALIQRTADWIPTESKATAVVAAPTKAAFTMPLDHMAIWEGKDAWPGIVEWLSTDESAELGRLLKTDLHTYVNSGSPAERLAREQALEGAFTAAALAAAPLVSIKSNVANAVHNMPGTDFTATVSTVPFPPGDPLHDRLVNILVTANLAPSAAIASRRFKTAATDNITFLTASARSMHAVVFDNVMAPAAEDWKRRRVSKFDRVKFWKWRRARPLPESVPISRDRLAGVIRGWYVADIIGQRQMTHDPTLGPKLEIWSGSAWLSFPYPLLARVDLPSARRGEPLEYLPTVLKSIGLALLEVYEHGRVDSMLAYHRLMDLGETYEDELLDWVDAGKPAPINAERAAGSPAMSPDERRQLVQDRLTGLRAQWADCLDAHATQPFAGVYGIPAEFEIAAEAIAALDDMIAVVK